MEIEIDGNIRLALNKKDHTSSVIESPKATGSIFIPRFVEYKKEKYNIISIKKKAFSDNNIIDITFPDDSEIITFEQRCFHFTHIRKLKIPAKLKYLETGWCCYIRELTDIEVSPKNKNFTYYNNQFLLGKSDDSKDIFDILHYARFDIKEAIIPTQVKIIKRFSFLNHDQLKSIIFPDNSEATTIEDRAFHGSPIEKLTVPAKLEVIDFSNFDNLYCLKAIEISPKNSTFSWTKDKYLLKKSNAESPTFNQFVFCRQDAKEAKIPSHIKEITDNAFNRCESLLSLTFEPDSSLEVINDSGLSFCIALKTVVFPASVKRIHRQALYGMQNLESVKFLGKSVEIASSAFSTCEKLKEISFPNAKELNFNHTNSFDQIPKSTRINIPKSAKITGPGLDLVKEQVNYIDGGMLDEEKVPTKSDKDEKKKDKSDKDEKKKDKSDKDDKKKDKSDKDGEFDKDRDVQLLMERIRFLEGCLRKYEKVESFDLETARKKKKAETKSEAKKDAVFIGDEDEQFHEVVEKIGEGATSIAYKVFDNRDHRVMCKKVLKTDDKQVSFDKFRNSLKEFEALISLDHPCICKAVGVNIQEKVENNKKSSRKSGTEGRDDPDDVEYESDNDDDDEDDNKEKKQEKTTVALFTEFLPYKLKDSLEKGIINNTLKVRVAVEVAFGMNCIHERGMMHRDLKIENVMLNYAYEAKIIDFDLVHFAAVEEEISRSLTKGIGTFSYMSPEMSNEEEYNNKTDVYSYGIFLFFMFTGHLPKQTLKEKMTNEKPIRFPHSSASISKYCIQLIKNCIEFDPSKRPSFAEIINDMKNHSFALADEIDTNIINERYQLLDQLRKEKK